MPFLLPLISLLLAVVAEVAFRRQRAGNRDKPTVWRWDSARLGAFVVLSSVAWYVAHRYGVKAEPAALATGLGIAVLAMTILSGRTSDGGVAAQLTSLAIGVAAGSSIHLLAVPSQTMAGIGLIVGVGIAAMAFTSDTVATAAVAALVVVAADYLSGRHSPTPSAAYLGSLAGLLALVGGVVASGLGTSGLGQKLSSLKGIVIGAVIVGGSLVATESVTDRFLLTSIAIGVGAAIVIDWLLADDDADATRVGLAAITGIGVATLTYGLARGAGMALALTGGLALVLARGNRLAALSLGPLLGLVLFRTLAEIHPGTSHALDIGQHYALLGLTLGAVLPLLPSEWLQGEHAPTSRWKAAVGAVLWGTVPLGVPPLVFLMFGDKGVVGFVVGVGFSGACQALRRSRALLPLALAGASAATTTLSLNWLTGVAEMNRSDKVKVLESAALALAAIGVLLAILSWNRPTGRASTAEASL